ncbi:hypothetical protein Y032_0301g1846 [Ancylostoma ceylanicum]|uniref:Uncharacterized protein n=1 Tax=Ancylostoma ceylanicum TaxID=53326 RepID=A0A016S3T4_9BILA|nr:hypothetical protein Y032_0301g1846 [Ancylostoma ceylanicum]
MSFFISFIRKSQSRSRFWIPDRASGPVVSHTLYHCCDEQAHRDDEWKEKQAGILVAIPLLMRTVGVAENVNDCNEG